MAPLLLAAALALCGAAPAQDFVPAQTQAALSEVGAQAQKVKPASPPEQACRALGSLGCYLVPPGLEGKEPALLVYFRGFWSGHGNERVQEGERLASSRQALGFYGLEAAAARAGAVVLVTGSSDAAVTEADIAAVEAQLGVSFKKVLLAAHSGGYNGLLKSLPGLRQPSRIAMLDDFYFTDKDKVKLLQDRVAAGAACSGFLTSHNEERWKGAFKDKLDCAVEKKDALGHNGAVNACLAAYLAGGTCP
ncbi:MAG: hypothetical protein HY928_05840 [Elusimicrobia bacterium]|nr:hypothetical protein [Elusimicrobiota bacterium]